MNYDLYKNTLIAAAGSLALISCALMESERYPLGTGNLDTRFMKHRVGTYYLPKSLIEVTVKKQGTGIKFEAKGVEVPDTKARYQLAFNPSIVSDDQFCVVRTDTGLLKQLTFITSDKTTDIAVNIAELLVRVFAPVPSGTIGRAAKNFGDLAEGAVIVTVTFDPLDKSSTGVASRQLRDALKAYGKEGYWLAMDQKDTEILEKNYTPPGSNSGMVFVRTKTRMPVYMTKNGERIAIAYPSVVLPNSTSTVDIRRAFGVEKVTDIRFSNGVLVGLKIRKPSEALAVVETPLRILDRILSIPAGFFAKAFGSSEVDRAKNEAAQAKLKTQLDALQAERAAAAPGTVINLTPGVEVKDNKTTVKCE